MNDKQRRFVAEYLKDLNGKQAAIRAGYSPKSAEVQASQLLSNPKVAEAVAVGTTKQLEQCEVDALWVKRELYRVAKQTGRAGIDGDGNYKSPKDWTDDEAAAIANVDVVIRNLAAGDGQTDRVVKIQKWDKMKALTDLAKHFGLLIEKHEHSGGIDLRWKGE